MLSPPSLSNYIVYHHTEASSTTSHEQPHGGVFPRFSVTFRPLAPPLPNACLMYRLSCLLSVAVFLVCVSVCLSLSDLSVFVCLCLFISVYLLSVYLCPISLCFLCVSVCSCVAFCLSLCLSLFYLPPPPLSRLSLCLVRSLIISLACESRSDRS